MINRNEQIVNEYSENELLISYLEGDEWAFHELVNRYKNPLYAFLRRFIYQQDVLEDVFQETFLQLYISQDRFDFSRPLRPWLFTIAANKARDAIRKMKRHRPVSIGILADQEDISIDETLNILSHDDVTPDQEFTSDETAQRVRQIISEMPKNLREILILAYYEQFSYEHMAKTLNIPLGTVKSRLHAAVVHFGKKWKQANQYLYYMS
jgi:RNA polymerase sigma-70 factor (ECF subfamily)